MKARSPYELRGFGSGNADVEIQLRELRDRNRYILDAKDGPAYRLGKWLQATCMGIPEAARFCRDEKIAMEKAINENVDSTGGWIVPEELAVDIVGMREAYGVVRRNARPWPLRYGGNSSVPRRATGATATWSTEGSALVDLSNTFDSAALTMKKLSIMIKASTEVEEDAIAGWGQFVAEEMAWAFAVAEDTAAFTGAGEPTNGHITGIQAKLNDGAHAAGKVVAASGHNTYATLDSTDIGALIGAIPARAIANAKLFVSTAGYGNTLVRLASTSGGLAAMSGPDGALRANYLGLPVVLTPSLPSATTTLTTKLMMAAGDMYQGLALGERRQFTVRRLAERFAELDQVAFMATERVDINVMDVGDATTPGALVGLFAP